MSLHTTSACWPKTADNTVPIWPLLPVSNTRERGRRGVTGSNAAGTGMVFMPTP